MEEFNEIGQDKNVKNDSKLKVIVIRIVFFINFAKPNILLLITLVFHCQFKQLFHDKNNTVN
jgi:hypothetical protein